ncbi:hypothetical protein GF337_01600 [candidate division KSB1 bacterium]|nr:hypothetical protein [candidate division KSB1 bacterium]
MENDINNKNNMKDCLNDDLLGRYSCGDVTNAEIEAVELHLNQCENCRQILASIIRNEFSPLTEAEKNEIEKRIINSPEELVEKLFAKYEQEDLQAKQDIKKRKAKNLIDKIKDFISRWEIPQQRWKPAIATLVLLAVSIISFLLAIDYYNTDYQISTAENILQDEHRIYIENARLSGGYQSSGISSLLAADDDEASYLDQAESRLENALEHDPHSNKAKQLLAQIFIIRQQQTRADSLYSEMDNQNKLSAPLLNDIGVLHFHQQDWQGADRYFQSAIDKDPNFPEPYYNLALTKIKSGDASEINVLLNKYMNLESDDAWKAAALRLKNRFHK